MSQVRALCAFRLNVYWSWPEGIEYSKCECFQASRKQTGFGRLRLQSACYDSHSMTTQLINMRTDMTYHLIEMH